MRRFYIYVYFGFKLYESFAIDAVTGTDALKAAFPQKTPGEVIDASQPLSRFYALCACHSCVVVLEPRDRIETPAVVVHHATY